MNNEFTRMQKLAGILTEGYQGTDYESSEDMALDMVKTGVGMPGTGLPEVKKKMTKMEAKKMIKDAILAEMYPEDPDEMESAAWDMAMREEGTMHESAEKWNKLSNDQKLDLLLQAYKDPDEAEEYVDYTWNELPDVATQNMRLKEGDFVNEAEATPDAMDRMSGLVSISTVGSLIDAAGRIIRDLKDEGFDEEDIHDFIVDKVTTLSLDETLAEAKKDEEDEEDVEIEDTETVEEPAGDEDMIDADMKGGMDMDAGSDEAKTAFDELTDAYRSAKELGDEKLIRQLANTITYFNKNIILK